MTRFLEALKASPSPLVAEIKPARPDGRSLTDGRSVGELVARYDALGPACLSVVTGRWFDGAAELVSEVRSLTSIPLLRKDFITRRSQLVESRDLGADAVLLTAGLLPSEGLNRLVDECVGLRLTPFVEVTTAQEISAIDRPDVCVVAVNNRDISTRETTGHGIERSRALAPAVLAAGAGCVASASGIESAQLAGELLDLGYEALLVGTALLTATDHTPWLDLTRPIKRQPLAAAA